MLASLEKAPTTVVDFVAPLMWLSGRANLHTFDIADTTVAR